jgi:hypothetical protein
MHTCSKRPHRPHLDYVAGASPRPPCDAHAAVPRSGRHVLVVVHPPLVHLRQRHRAPAGFLNNILIQQSQLMARYSGHGLDIACQHRFASFLLPRLPMASIFFARSKGLRADLLRRRPLLGEVEVAVWTAAAAGLVVPRQGGAAGAQKGAQVGMPAAHRRLAVARHPPLAPGLPRRRPQGGDYGRCLCVAEMSTHNHSGRDPYSMDVFLHIRQMPYDPSRNPHT